MIRAIILAVLSLLIPLSSSAQSGGSNSVRIVDTGVPSSGGTIDGDIEITGDIQFACNTCPCLIYQEAATTDVAACGINVKAGNASPIATGAKQAGAPLVLSGGLGSDYITITNVAISANDTVVISGTRADLVAYTDTYTAVAAAPGAGQFVCATDVATCATNLAALITVTASEYTADSSAGVVRIYPVQDQNAPLSCSIVIADGAADGAFATDTEGADGPVVFRSGESTSSPIQFNVGGNLVGIGVSTAGGGQMWLYAANTRQARVTASGINSDNDFITTTAEKGIYNSVDVLKLGSTITNKHGLGTGSVGTGGSYVVNGATWLDGEVYGIVEADLTAGACTAKRLVVDTGGASRENCRCNSAGTAYDCCSIAASPTCSTNGPVD